MLILIWLYFLIVCRPYFSLLFNFLHLPRWHVCSHHVCHAADPGRTQTNLARQALHTRCRNYRYKLHEHRSWSVHCVMYSLLSLLSLSGLVIRPRADDTFEIVYTKEDTESWDLYAQTLDKFLQRKFGSCPLRQNVMTYTDNLFIVSWQESVLHWDLSWL